jgi:hypothetical protein
MMNKPVEERIASTLAAADDVKSADLAALIQEVETAAQAADEAATKAREQALDPAVVVDAAKVGAAVASATLTRDRLQAALSRLHEQLKQARAGERRCLARGLCGGQGQTGRDSTDAARALSDNRGRVGHAHDQHRHHR